MLPSDAFERAAVLIEENGWVQGKSREGGRMCADYALWMASDCDINDYASMRAFHGADSFGIIGFNDASGRTADEVIAKLREFAAAARGVGK